MRNWKVVKINNPQGYSVGYGAKYFPNFCTPDLKAAQAECLKREARDLLLRLDQILGELHDDFGLSPDDDDDDKHSFLYN